MTRGRHALGGSGRRRRRVRVLYAAAGLLLIATKAFALGNGELTLSAEETVANDDNVFRIPKGQDPTTVIGSPQRGDTYYTTTLGANFDVPVSRQRFQGGYTWNDVRYNRYSQLDYTGHDGRVSWLWQVGSDANGQLAYIDTTAPSSFGGVQGRTSSLLRTKQGIVDGTVLVTPSWRVYGKVREFDQRNSTEASQIDNVDILSGDVAVSYVSAANNSLGVVGRVEDGRYPNREFVPGGDLDHAYRQYNVGMALDWTITGKSHLIARAEYASRGYDQLTERNWDGFLGRIQYDWKPTGKLSVTTIARREIDPYDTTRATFTLVKAITLAPTWNATDKVDVSGIIDYSVRDYLAGAQLACGVAPGTNDKVRTATALVAYRPARWLTLQLSGQHQSCTSEVAFGNYVTNIFALGARLAF